MFLVMASLAKGKLFLGIQDFQKNLKIVVVGISDV